MTNTVSILVVVSILLIRYSLVANKLLLEHINEQSEGWGLVCNFHVNN